MRHWIEILWCPLCVWEPLTFFGPKNISYAFYFCKGLIWCWNLDPPQREEFISWGIFPLKMTLTESPVRDSEDQVGSRKNRNSDTASREIHKLVLCMMCYESLPKEQWTQVPGIEYFNSVNSLCSNFSFIKDTCNNFDNFYANFILVCKVLLTWSFDNDRTWFEEGIYKLVPWKI